MITGIGRSSMRMSPNRSWSTSMYRYEFMMPPPNGSFGLKSSDIGVFAMRISMSSGDMPVAYRRATIPPIELATIKSGFTFASSSRLSTPICAYARAEPPERRMPSGFLSGDSSLNRFLKASSPGKIAFVRMNRSSFPSIAGAGRQINASIEKASIDKMSERFIYYILSNNEILCHGYFARGFGCAKARAKKKFRRIN